MKNLMILSAIATMMLFACKKDNTSAPSTPITHSSSNPVILQHDSTLIGTWVMDSMYDNNNGKMLYSQPNSYHAGIGYDTTVLYSNWRGQSFNSIDPGARPTSIVIPWNTSNDTIYYNGADLFSYGGGNFKYSITGSRLEFTFTSPTWVYDTWVYYHKL